MREGGVAATSQYSDREDVSRRGAGAVEHRDRPHIHIRHEVTADNRIDSIKRSAPNYLDRPARRQLLGVLEHEANLAR